MMDYRIIFLPEFDKKIVNAIQTADRPLNASEIMDTIYETNPPMYHEYHNKRSTIYRHLESLSSRGILKKTQVHENKNTKDYVLFEFLAEAVE